MLSSIKSFVIAFAVSLIIFGALGYYATPYLKDVTNNFIRPASATEDTEKTPENTISEDTEPSDTSYDPSSLFEGQQSFNLLLIGSDYQPDVFSDYRVSVANSSDIEELASHQRHYSADVIVLVRYSAETGTVMFSAIPSNLTVTASGISMKLSEVLEAKNVTYFIGTVESVTGLTIDHYVYCQIKMLDQLVQLLGGMKFDVPVDMYYVDPEERIVEEGASRDPILKTDEYGRPIYDQDGNPLYIAPGKDFTINLKQGIQTLNGEKATWVLRFKSYSGGYAAYRDTQVKFFSAMFEQFLKPEYRMLISKAFSDIRASSYGDTDITDEVFEDIADTFLNYASYDKVTVTFPGRTSVNGGIESVSYSRSEVYSTYAKYKLK